MSWQMHATSRDRSWRREGVEGSGGGGGGGWTGDDGAGAMGGFSNNGWLWSVRSGLLKSESSAELCISKHHLPLCIDLIRLAI